jgi:transposase
MSTSLLYHAFGIQGYRYVRTRYEKGCVTFTVGRARTDLRCSVCGGRKLILKGSVSRRFRTLPIGSRPVWIEMAVPRVQCLACGLVRQVEIDFADPRRSYTRAFSRYVLELLKHMTIKAVARHLKVGWDLVKDIQKRNLQTRFARPVLKNLTRIAIDEISIGSGHRYLTVVLDLMGGAVVFVGDGKGADALAPFFRRLRHSKAQITAVAIDMSPAYIAAVSDNLPEAAIVFDHFHVVKMFNDRLSDFRRALYEHTEKIDRNVLKGSRWLLLKNPENLDESRKERERLNKALLLNQPLATVYYMKEDLRRLWTLPDKNAARDFLNDWIARARASEIKMLGKFANTLGGHRTGILAYYDHPISTGPLEGTNNKIKTMKRQAYGFRDMEFFKLKIMAIHEARYALVG